MSKGRLLGKLLGSSGSVPTEKLAGNITIEKLAGDIPITEKFATASLLPATGTVGEQAFVEGSNRLYIWNGSGWYNIALINTTPTWDSGGQPAGSYVLDADSPQDATVITLAASDQEGLPISYTYVTGGQMDSIATISQDSSVFTITPKTSVQAPDGGTGSITFRATDGVNILPQVSSFTLTFISIIDDSKYTTLLATADGTSDNNNITDASSNNHSITVTGDAHAGTFSPYRHGGYSTKFEPNSYFNILNQPAIGSGDCSIECWVNVSTLSQWHGIIKRGDDDQAGNFQFYVRNDTEIYLNWSGSSAGTAITTSGANIQPNTWYWLQVIRSSGTVNIYVNGVSKASFSDSSNISSTTYYDIGGWTGNFSDAFIRDLRVSTVARSSSTGPSDKLEVDSDTTFLTCNLPYVTFSTPSAVNNYVQYISGTVSTKPFSPYDYNEYDAADNGGSVYFVGGADYSSQYLSLSGPGMPSGDFTLSTWAYLTHTVADSKTLIDFNGNSDGFRIIYANGSNGYHFRFYTAGGTVYLYDQSIAHSTNQWYYIVVVRDSGTFKLYVNNKLINTSTANPTFSSSTNVRIGQTFGGSGTLEGYLSDIIYNPTTAITDFTPPTAPLSSSGTSLHIKGTDASIIDKSQNTNLKLVGNTTGSTTQVKFAGTKSMYFDGSSDRIEIDGPINLGTQPFTYETWVYTTDNSWIFMCIGNHDGSSSHATAGSIIEYANNNFYIYKAEGGSITANTSASGSVHNQGWKHVAYCRQSNGNHDLYLDGTRIMNYTGWNSQDYGSLDKILIGDYFSQFMSDFNGYFQDIRLTIGESRYTANFTPPTASLEG
jgi:hypothetical protein